MTESSLAQLLEVLARAPTMAEVDPLTLLCLPPEVEVVTDIEAVIERLDALTPHSEQPILVPRVDSRYRHRFQVFAHSVVSTPMALTSMLGSRFDDARRWLLTHRQVPDRIVSDATQHRYRVLALLLVDGLSYEDTRAWQEAPAPCLIDGPSITYGRDSLGQIVPEVGFAGIVGTPPLARRLIDVGLPRSIGFSYWQREQNYVSAHLFRGVPLTRVSGLASAMEALSDQLLDRTYVQLVREGLDGLAHGRREVTPQEIEGTVQAIRNDYHRLIEIVAATGLPGAVYLTADHGILWKAQHVDLHQVDGLPADHPRYDTSGNLHEEYALKLSFKQQNYSLYRYPYLGAAIRANDSGVHGGLSFWESLVPFVRVEVNL